MPQEKKARLPESAAIFEFELRSCGPVWTTTQSSSSSMLWLPPLSPAQPLGIIQYELSMFFGLIDARDEVEQLNPSLKRIVINALTESTLLHARTLCSIFLNEGRQSEIKLKTLLGQYNPNDRH